MGTHTHTHETHAHTHTHTHARIWQHTDGSLLGLLPAARVPKAGAPLSASEAAPFVESSHERLALGAVPCNGAVQSWLRTCRGIVIAFVESAEHFWRSPHDGSYRVL